MRLFLLALFCASAGQIFGGEPNNPWAGYGGGPGDPSYDRPVPEGWGADATMVFSRNAPATHNPTCCEDVWRCYPLERKCPCDRGGCGPCRHGKHRQGGAVCASCAAQGAASCEHSGVIVSEGSPSPHRSAPQAVQTTPTMAPGKAPAHGTEGLPVITNGVGPAGVIHPQAGEPVPAVDDNAPMPGALDLKDENSEVTPAQNSEEIPTGEQPKDEPTEAQGDAPAGEESADMKAETPSSDSPEATEPMDEVEPSESSEAPMGDAPESEAPAAEQKETNGDESARVQGPDLFRVSNRPQMIQRIFRGRK